MCICITNALKLKITKLEKKPEDFLKSIRIIDDTIDDNFPEAEGYWGKKYEKLFKNQRSPGQKRGNGVTQPRGSENKLIFKNSFINIQSLILSGKNILQELLCRELMTMRHVSFIQNLDNLDGYLYSDRQSSNFLNNETQSNLNLLRNGSYATKSIECSNYKQDRAFSFIKQLLNKIIQFLPCHVLFLSFGRVLNHIEHFIEERCSYSLSMDTPCLQDGR